MPKQANQMCESCMMPFAKDTGTRESPQYCSLCYQNGELCYKGTDLKEFQALVREQMKARGANPLFIRFAVFMVRFAPRWKK